MKTLITLMTCLFLSVACLESGEGSSDNSSSNNFNGNNSGSNTTTTNPSSSTSPTTTVPGSLPGSGSTTGSSTSKCYDPGVGSGFRTYYTLPMQGAGNGSNDPQWSSRFDIADSNATEGIFVTDSRLHVRVIARPAPAPGGECDMQNQYEKLSLSLSIKGRNSGNYLQTLVFNEVKVDECSAVLRYTTIPNNSPAEPFIMEVHNVKSDFECNWDPYGTEGCPTMIPIAGRPNTMKACWKIELQMATDNTQDIPR